MHSTNLKKHKKRTIRRNQSSIKNNAITQTFDSFSKSVCNGTFRNPAALPTFSVNQANDFYGPKYSQIEPLNKDATIKPMTFMVQNILK